MNNYLSNLKTLASQSNKQNYSKADMTNLLKLCQFDLIAFCMAVNPSFRASWHHRLIAEKLELASEGKIKRLIINMPPRHGKSMLCSELFPAWYLGRYPKNQIIATSYGQELADDFGRKVRDLLSNEIYQEVFNTRLNGKSSASNRFHTNLGGAYYAIGAGGAITGRGGNLIIIDDPIKDESTANSPTMRRKLKSWFQSVAFTRLMPNGSIVIIQTRWHEDDLAGWCIKELAKENWEVLSLPAINDKNEALWADQFSIEDLMNIKQTVGSRVWSALYQQSPAPEDGGILKLEWFQRFDNPPSHFDFIIQSWDTASKVSELNDPSVCVTIGYKDNNYYILDIFRKNLEYPDLKRSVINLHEKYSPSFVVIEDASSGQALIQDLYRTSMLPVVAIRPDKSKIIRASAVSGLIESKRCFLPNKADWLIDFESELMLFPNSKHDDQVDALTQGLAYLRDKLQTIVEYDVLERDEVGIY